MDSPIHDSDIFLPIVLREALNATIPNELLELALTHPSAVGEGLERTLKSNQRLEFLGDAIVGAVIAAHWYDAGSTLPEGELTQRKSAVVQKKSLARAGAKLELEKCIRLGRGGDAMRGRGRDAVLADTFEALVGALFLAEGWDAARDFVLRSLGEEIENIAQTTQTANIKNLLQEYTQANELGTPIYHTQQTGGPAHARLFSSQVLLLGIVRGSGEGISMKEAECQAAQTAMDELQSETVA